jgi:hypothetical protein
VTASQTALKISWLIPRNGARPQNLHISDTLPYNALRYVPHGGFDFW